MFRWLLPRPPSPTIATLILSFAPQTRIAEAAVAAPRKNLREVGFDIARSIISAGVGRHWRKPVGVEPTEPLSEGATGFEDQAQHRPRPASNAILPSAFFLKSFGP